MFHLDRLQPQEVKKIADYQEKELYGTGWQDFQALVSLKSRVFRALSRNIAEAIKTSHR
jgi:hypothetical protein